MGQWQIEGQRNGETRRWKIEAPDEATARRLAESKGVHVLQIAPLDGGIMRANPTPPAVREHLPNAQSQHVVAIPSIERCANCDAPIGRLETPQIWQDAIVCGACFSKLARPFGAGLAAPVPAQPQIIMMQTPAAAPAPAIHVSSAPVVHVHSTNVNTNVVRVRRGCLGSLIHTIFVLVAIVIFLVGVLALVGYLASRK
jgi:hypothetical protein